MMNKALKQKWIAGLKGGEYKQTTGTLQRKDGSFCCLGVLCDVSGAGTWGQSNYHKFFESHRAGRRELTLEDGDFGLSLRYITELTNLNDSGKSFDAIADYIDKEIPGIEQGQDLGNAVLPET